MKIKNLHLFVLLFFILLSSGVLHAQKRSHVFSLSPDFVQVKEDLNRGMVFDGAQLHFRYTYKKYYSSAEFRYQAGLSWGMAFNLGMGATQFHFGLADLSYLKNIYKTDKHILKLGGTITDNYNFNRYPDLQSGHLFWCTEIGIDMQMQYTFCWKEHQINVCFTNSLAGLTSRPDASPDPYFYSLRFADYIKYSHSHMKFGSFNNYVHTILTAEYLPKVTKRHSISAGIDYFGLTYQPSFKRLIYFVQWNKTFTK
jgi:hypothetical protein